MVSKIFVRKDGSYCLNEFDKGIQNKSVIPPKYSVEDISFKQRLEILKSNFKS